MKYKKTNIIFFLFLFNLVAFAQYGKFFHTWLDYDYYTAIENGQTPHELEMKPVMQVFFLPDSSKILIGSFNEGMYYDYKFIDSEHINVFDNYNDTIFNLSLLNENNLQKLIVEPVSKMISTGVFNKGEKFVLIPLADKYYCLQGIDYYINDKFLTGEYISAEDSAKIIFTTDGKVSGIDKYTEYRIPLFSFEFPEDYDCFMLYGKNRNGRYSAALYWINTNEGLILYELDTSEIFKKLIEIQ